MTAWRSALCWAFVAAGLISWILAGERAWMEKQGGLGIAGLAWILNGFLSFCGAVYVRLGERRADEAARQTAEVTHLSAEIKGMLERERYLEKRNAALQAQVELLSALREVSRALTGETRFEPVVTQIFSIVEGLLAPEAIALYLPGHDQSPRLTALRIGGETRFAKDGHPPQAGKGADGMDPRVAASAWAARRLHREAQTLAIPLAAGDAEMGVLAVRLPSGSEGVDEVERTLRDLAKHVAIALQNPNLRSAAVTDALTGLYTKRHFLERAPAMVIQQRRQGDKLALLMTDLDHFKKINDTYGHPAGDAVLKEIAHRIARTIRGSDTAYRFGGEEMACLLPGAPGPVAMRVANRIRKIVAEEPVALSGGQTIPVTISIGVAAMTPEMTSWEALLSAADQALYQAKTTGRDKVVLFKERK